VTGKVYNLSMASQGTLNVTWPTGGNAPHPTLFSFGNTEYLLSFDDDTVAGAGQGNLVLAKAPNTFHKSRNKLGT